MDLSKMDGLRSDVRLFSEAPSRWVVELKKGKERQVPRDRKTKMVRLGTVGGDSLDISSKKRLVDLDVDKLAESFNGTLWRLMG